MDAEVVTLENIVPPVEDIEALQGDDHQLGQEFYDRLSAALGDRIRQCGPRVPVVTGDCFTSLASDGTHLLSRFLRTSTGIAPSADRPGLYRPVGSSTRCRT